MAHIGDWVRHAYTQEMGRLIACKDNVFLVEFGLRPVYTYGLYRNDEIGYAEHANTSLYYATAAGVYKTEG